MIGYDLLAALGRMPDECLSRPVVVEAGTGIPDAPVFAVAMTGPGAGVLLLTTPDGPDATTLIPPPRMLTQAITSGYDLDKEIEVGSVPPFEPGVVIVKAVDDEKCVRVKLTPDEADSLADMLRAVAAHAREAAS